MNIEENLKKSSQKEIEEIKNLFLDNYPDSKTELSYKNLYELIVSVILSAQCTDRRGKCDNSRPPFLEKKLFPRIIWRFLP